MILFLEQMGKRLSALFYAAGWQYASGTVGVKSPGSKTVDYVYLRCCYFKNANGANFDRIKMNIKINVYCRSISPDLLLPFL